MSEENDDIIEEPKPSYLNVKIFFKYLILVYKWNLLKNLKNK